MMLKKIADRNQFLLIPATQMARCIGSGMFYVEDVARRQFTIVLADEELAIQQQR